MSRDTSQSSGTIHSASVSHDLLKSSDEDDSSTGTVQRHSCRSYSCSSDEPEKLPLTVRNNDSLCDEDPSDRPSSWNNKANDYKQARRCKSNETKAMPKSLVLTKARSMAAIHDPNVTIAVADSIRLARRRVLQGSQMEVAHVSNDSKIPKNPLQRWVKTLHRRNVKREKVLKQREERWCLDEFDDIPRTSDSGKVSNTGHKKSSSWASSGFVTAIKSATASLTTMSIAAPSKNQGSVVAKENDRESVRSRSLEHTVGGVQLTGQKAVDEASLDRAYKRRNIIHEIVKTEESYIQDLKLLIDYYRTIRQRININTTNIASNLNDILDLHEILLLSITPVLAYSGLGLGQQSWSQLERKSLVTWPSAKSENKSQSKTEATTKISTTTSSETESSLKNKGERVMSEPEDSAEVARAFNKLIGHLFVYEEYGSSFTTMMHQFALSEKCHNMESYNKGFEALANTTASCSTKEATRRKGLTYSDLLMKPIQRITKYPLLFSDLLSQTPVIDCPESCREVEKTLFRLRETVDEINKATNDEYAHEKILRSWRLQDLICFPKPIQQPFAIRSLGHAKLCGVLHAAYQTTTGVSGEYLFCALFKSCMVLAARPRQHERGLPFSIVGSISLTNAEVHNCDNGIGLQCYNALYSWKVVFEADQNLFELIFSACSRQEETQWRTLIKYLADKETRLLYDDDPRAPEQYSRLFFVPYLQPFAEAFGQPGTLARRLSIRRPATVGARTVLNQVAIRNTYSLRTHNRNASGVGVGRSQTVDAVPRMQTLAPRRLDRIYMEQDMAEVWTKELIPYPGMSSRSESHIRASASTVMRRLSRATNGSFGRRSLSHNSVNSSQHGEAEKEALDGMSLGLIDSRFNLIPLMECPRGSSTPLKVPRPPGSHNSRDSGTEKRAPIEYVAGTRSRVDSCDTHRHMKPRLRNKFIGSLSVIRAISTEKIKALFNQTQKENFKLPVPKGSRET